MAQAKGSKLRLIYQQETAFNSDPASAAASRLRVISESLRLTINQGTDPILRDNRNPSRPWRGNKSVSGDLITNLQAYQLPSIIKFALGQVATVDASGVGDGPFTHTITVADSLPSFLVEKGFTDIGQYVKYNGLKVSRLAMTCKPEGRQQVTVGVLGCAEATGAASFDAAAEDNGYRPFDGFQVSSITEGGAAIATVTSLDFSVDNVIDGDSGYTMGSDGERTSLPEGTIKVSGNITALFEDMTLYNKAVAGTETSLKVAYQFGTGDGSAGNEYIEFLIPELIYSPQTPVASGPAGILVELPFDAYYEDDAEASAMQVIVKNMEAAI